MIKRAITTFKQFFLVSLLFFISLPSNAPIVSAQTLPQVTVTTSFLEDIVKQIAANTVDISLIIPAGGDPHTYNASAKDLPKILEADLLLYHGLNFEAQMATALADYGYSVTDNFSQSDLIFLAEDSNEVDPHYWFDLDLYRQSVLAVRDHLITSNPKQTELYTTNTEHYLERLAELAQWINHELESLPVEQRILITPHDAFAYFARLHQFTVYAPQGISTEAEVSNEQIVQTVNYIVDHQVPAIFLDSTTNPQAMQKLQEGVQQRGSQVEVIGMDSSVLYSDSLATSGQANDNYIDMYKHNVSLIVEHLRK